VAIKFRCRCGRLYCIPDGLAGKRAKCKACGAPFTVPDLEPSRRVPPAFALFTDLHLREKTKEPAGKASASPTAAPGSPTAEGDEEVSFDGMEFDLQEKGVSEEGRPFVWPADWLHRPTPWLVKFSGVVVMAASAVSLVLVAREVFGSFMRQMSAGASPSLLGAVVALSLAVAFGGLTFAMGALLRLGRRLAVSGLVILSVLYVPAGLYGVIAGPDGGSRVGVVGLVLGGCVLMPSVVVSMFHWGRLR